ncbi:MAG: nucleotide exchange factor GrpE [Myxococcota bacterium]
MSGDPKQSEEECGSPQEETAGEAKGSSQGADSKVAPGPELEEALREAVRSLSEAEPAPEDEASAESGVDLSATPLETLEQEKKEVEDRLLRTQADFENFRKRSAQKHQEALHRGQENLVKDLLSVVDNLERAIDHARESEDGDLQGLLQGVELVERELRGALGKHHVKEIEAEGKPFDPMLHEAMAQRVVEGVESNRVVEVLQKGYQLRDHLVRPARVVVAKAAEPGESDPAEAQETAD